MGMLESLNHLKNGRLIGLTKAGSVLYKINLKSPLADDVDVFVSYDYDFNPDDGVVMKFGERYFNVVARDKKEGKVQLEVCTGVQRMAEVMEVEGAEPDDEDDSDEPPLLKIDQDFGAAMDEKILRVCDDDALDLNYQKGTILAVQDNLGSEQLFRVVEEYDSPANADTYGFMVLEALVETVDAAK